jgi:hypothetical protein
MARSQAGMPEAASLFLSLLHELTQLHSMRQELALLPRLCSALITTLGAPMDNPAAVSVHQLCLTLALTLLFLRNSKPLHKYVLSSLRKPFATPHCQALLEPILRTLLLDTSTRALAAQPGCCSLPDIHAIPTVQAWTSLLAYPPAAAALASRAVIGLATLASNTYCVLTGIQRGHHACPSLSQDLQVFISMPGVSVQRRWPGAVCWLLLLKRFIIQYLTLPHFLSSMAAFNTQHCFTFCESRHRSPVCHVCMLGIAGNQ